MGVVCCSYLVGVVCLSSLDLYLNWCRAAELDILVTDLERANQRAAAAAEKETERLQQVTSDRQTTNEQDKVCEAMMVWYKWWCS